MKVNISDDLDTDVRLVQTCGATPEQYDAFDRTGKPAGYLRLRHGHFTVSFPDVDGELLYEAYPCGDGAFADDERLYYLRQAILAIRLKLGLPAKPSKIYSIAEVAAHLGQLLKEVDKGGHVTFGKNSQPQYRLAKFTPRGRKAVQ